MPPHTTLSLCPQLDNFVPKNRRYSLPTQVQVRASNTLSPTINVIVTLFAARKSGVLSAFLEIIKGSGAFQVEPELYVAKHPEFLVMALQLGAST